MEKYFKTEGGEMHTNAKTVKKTHGIVYKSPHSAFNGYAVFC